MSEDEAALVRELREMNRGAFDHLVLRYREKMLGIARVFFPKDLARAEDAVQRACLRLFERFDYQGTGTLEAYVMSVLRNCCIDEKRKQSTTPRKVLEGYKCQKGEERLTIPWDENAVIQKAMDDLSPEQREALVLCEMDRLSYAEIAQRQGVPVGTVRSRIFTAREFLKDRLLEYRRNK